MLSSWILAVVTLAQAGGTATSAEWKPFTSAKGKFTVSMPAKPTEKRRVLAVSGKTIDLVSLSARKGLATYTTAYAELAGADSAAAIKVAQADLLAQSRGELKEEKEITLGESPGKEVVIEIPRKVVAGGAIQSTRIYVVGGRLYELIAVVPTAKAESLADEMSSFFDSFQPAGVTLAVEAGVKPKSKTEVARPATSKAPTAKSVKAPPMPANPGGAVLGGLSALNPFAGRGAPAIAAPQPAEAARGIVFKSPDGSFSITSPDKLIVQDLNLPLGMAGGAKTNAKLYQVFQGSKIFRFIVSDLPPEAFVNLKVPEQLAKLRDAAVRGGSGKLVREQLMVRDGVQGIEFVASSPKIESPKGGVAINRAFIDVRGKRLYVLSVLGPVGTDEEKSVKDFLDSFHILGAANR